MLLVMNVYQNGEYEVCAKEELWEDGERFWHGSYYEDLKESDYPAKQVDLYKEYWDVVKNYRELMRVTNSYLSGEKERGSLVYSETVFELSPDKLGNKNIEKTLNRKEMDKHLFELTKQLKTEASELKEKFSKEINEKLNSINL